MGDHDGHSIEACSRVWQTLRLAHDRVARRLGTELARDCALSPNEFDLLLYLRLHAAEEVRIGSVLEAVPLSQPALSRLVARLEARGLLARSAAAGDGRAVLLGLTDAGAALADRAAAIHAQVVQETLTGKFTEAEQAELLRTLDQICR